VSNVGFLGADILAIGVAGVLALAWMRTCRRPARALLLISWYVLLIGADLAFLSLTVWATASRSDDLVAVAFVGVMIMSLAGVLALASQAALGRAHDWTVWVAGTLWLLLAIEAALLSGEPEEGTATLVLVVIPFWTLIVGGPLFGIAVGRCLPGTTSSCIPTPG
jgi:tellurite resistance protein TehA-like permease